MDPEIMHAVSGASCRCLAAVLPNHVRKKVRGEVFPGMIGETGARVEGLLYLDVPAPAIDRLDRFEGLQYVRQEVTVTGRNGKRIAGEAYVFAVDAINQLTDDEWDFKEFMKTGKAEFLDRWRAD